MTNNQLGRSFDFWWTFLCPRLPVGTEKKKYNTLSQYSLYHEGNTKDMPMVWKARWLTATNGHSAKRSSFYEKEYSYSPYKKAYRTQSHTTSSRNKDLQADDLGWNWPYSCMKEPVRGMVVYEQECLTNKALERKLTGCFSCSVVIWKCSRKIGKRLQWRIEWKR